MRHENHIFGIKHFPSRCDSSSVSPHTLENQSLCVIPAILNMACGYADVRSLLRTRFITVCIIYLRSTQTCRIRRAEIRYATAYSMRDYRVASDDRSILGVAVCFAPLDASRETSRRNWCRRTRKEGP